LILPLLLLSSGISAHFTLDYPESRGFDEDIENDNLCGGFHEVKTPRQPWYYKDGPVEIDSHHDTATVNIFVSFAQDVTSAVNFTQLEDGTKIPSLRQNLQITGQGEFCFHANASALSLPGQTISNGTLATLMVEHISVHGRLYQCSDVVFVDDRSVGSNISCTDSLTAATSTSSSSDDGHDHDHSSTATSSSSSPTSTINPSSSNSNSNGS
ncbi:hypothetical protein IE53DRAFT_305706, partial [Violaceomyces palustris]